MWTGAEPVIARKTIVTTATLTHTTPRLDHAYSNHESHGPNSESAERSRNTSEEKLEDAEWWGIPVVDAAAFWAMLRGDGVAAAPSSSGRAPKRRRRKK